MKWPIWLVMALGLSLGWTAAAATREFSGTELARRLGCWACHSLGGQGGTQATPLDRIGARFSPAELAQVLTCPRSRHPQAKMPSYAFLRPEEMQVLIDYLQSLKQ